MKNICLKSGFKFTMFNQYGALLFFLIYSAQSYASVPILLAENNLAKTTIVLSPNPSETQQFAAEELAKYLQQISHAVFTVTSSKKIKDPAIYFKLDQQVGKERYSILCDGGDIILSGNEDRTVLYAVYDFLSRLGCQWLAPQFSFYNGTAEYIPYKSKLTYTNTSPVIVSPEFSYRKLDIEEGLSHTTENLKQLIDWMPKSRFNILMVPSDYQGSGRVKWDNWREQLTPELKKRGLLIEVGGHGYQNFINPAMEDGTLFEKHPEWFGKNKECQPDKSEYLVFNTENAEAVTYFIGNILKYIKEHPEIDIFDLWPPDSGKWAECPSFLAFGSPEDRQARLINRVDSAVKAYRPDLKLQILAYAKTIEPPKNIVVNKGVLVDFCPIDQNFESQIYDTLSATNRNYVRDLDLWRAKFSGDIGLYSYFRKYAWKSLPNVIPNYIQKDMQWYAKVPLQGIVTYAEPGDWYTYELNHYVLGHLNWNTEINVDSLTQQYCHIRYGKSWEIAQDAYKLLENTVRFYGNIRFSSLKTPNEITQAMGKIDHEMESVNKVKELASATESANFDKLLLMLQYAKLDMQIRKALAENAPQQTIYELADKIRLFLVEHKNQGTFIVRDRESTANIVKRYQRKD